MKYLDPKAVLTFLEDSKQEGRAEGLAEGIAEGRSQRNQEIARTLLKMGMLPNKIAEATGLSLEAVQAMTFH